MCVYTHNMWVQHVYTYTLAQYPHLEQNLIRKQNLLARTSFHDVPHLLNFCFVLAYGRLPFCQPTEFVIWKFNISHRRRLVFTSIQILDLQLLYLAKPLFHLLAKCKTSAMRLLDDHYRCSNPVQGHTHTIFPNQPCKGSKIFRFIVSMHTCV